MNSMNSRIPLIIAIVLLLFPPLYVGSYLALVVPRGRMIRRAPHANAPPVYMKTHYRIDSALAERVFWPPEQVDRQLRAKEWAELQLGLKYYHSTLLWRSDGFED